jgi:hypothetical protein
MPSLKKSGLLETKLRSIIRGILTEDKKGQYPEGMTSTYDKEVWDKLLDDEERGLWWDLVLLSRKYMSMNRFKPGTPPWVKDSVKRATVSLEKYRRNREKRGLNIDVAKSIFKRLGLSSVKYTSTAIRGYSRPSSMSYEISKYDPSNIEFNGIPDNLFNLIVSELESSGFKIERKDPPSKVIGQANHASITLGK